MPIIMARAFRGFFLALGVFFAAGSPAGAQVTPSHVYQVVDHIFQELEDLHRADFSAPPAVQLNLTKRQPRHVLQKAQEIYTKVQKLRSLNGLPANPMLSIPVRKVTPGDVREAVRLSLRDLEAVRQFYQLAPAPKPDLPAKKTPTDVYGHLTRVSASLDALGLPVVVPNDVYLVAETLVSELELIVRHKGLDAEVPLVAVSGKSPAAVYGETHALLETIRKLTENPAFEIKGGVVLLNEPKGAIKPAHVMDSLSNAMAEIGAIKEKIGLTEPTKFAAPRSGITPSDVFAIVVKARRLVERLAREQAGGLG